MKITYRITSRFGDQESFRVHEHKGIDFAMPEGTELRSLINGKVRIADYGNTNAGKTIFIEGEDGRTYIYGHLSDFNVVQGQEVSTGELIGWSGNTGYSTGPHLHFGIKEGGAYIDPEPVAHIIQDMNEGLKQLYTQNQQIIDNRSFLDTFTVGDFSQILQQFNEVLSQMKFNLISLQYAIHKGLPEFSLTLYELYEHFSLSVLY
ncbi:metallo-endopeptidase [Bacillus phage Shbh1]|uniref:Metalloendopeptidase-like membrane protein n=1 Tax=Bacillus phage Shbh1 TaxID=1796992 RepID=A0A142F145_9CAUD|nr:metallo-endopeptidase [Bacillus phage Shbh1]AMQ66502.1 metalloendopeptidase-like membrane protein [Bacillus phage Shbh1]